VVAAATHQRAFTGKLLGNPVLSWVGTRSYGLYLYHWPIYQIIRGEAGKLLSPVQFVLAMLITVPLTEASYRFIEMPIRKGAIGNWLRGERRRPSATVLARRRQLAGLGVVGVVLLGWAGVSIAMAPNRCVGEVECSLDAADEFVADNTTTTVVDSAVPTATDPNATVDPNAPTTTVDPNAPVTTVDPNAVVTTTPVTPLPTTTVPVAERPPIAVGESVMKGAIPQLTAGGFTVYAEESRQGSGIAEVIGQLRASGQIGSTIVIQTGTNGPVDAAVYDQIMGFLPAAEVTKVVFLTVHADRGWIAGNNQLIWALPGKYPNVSILDWDGLVASGQVPGMAGDGIHLNKASAKQFYANYIFSAIGRNDLVLPLPE
jgi:hypothetical protein